MSIFAGAELRAMYSMTSRTNLSLIIVDTEVESMVASPVNLRIFLAVSTNKRRTTIII